jgi:hypothetical protein
MNNRQGAVGPYNWMLYDVDMFIGFRKIEKLT